MHMKYLILLGALLGGLLGLQAQSIERSVIGSTGGYAETATVSVSSTVGETVISTVSNGTIILTQGFQQPSDQDITSVRQPELALGYKVYPNPTSETLFIELNSPQAVSLDLALFDIQGRAVGGLGENLTVQGEVKRSWDLSQLSEGSYVLRVIEQGGRVAESIRIQKR